MNIATDIENDDDNHKYWYFAIIELSYLKNICIFIFDLLDGINHNALNEILLKIKMDSEHLNIPFSFLLQS